MPLIRELSAETTPQQIGVIIADDHPVLLEGMAAILRSEKGIKVIAEATNGEETCQLCDRLSPDVLLLDLRMPNKDGLQVVAELMSRRGPKPRIVVMTAYDTEEDIRHALKAGATGYLVKGTAPHQIREAVRRAAEGEFPLSSAIAAKLAESMAHPELSERERQVLKQIANGRTGVSLKRRTRSSQASSSVKPPLKIDRPRAQLLRTLERE